MKLALCTRAVALVFSLGMPSFAAGQAPIQRAWSQCSGGISALEPNCADAGLALQALHGGFGLLMAAGGALPTSPSTLGQRLPGAPRIVVDAGLGWASFRHPELSRSPGAALPDTRSSLVSGRLTGAVGVFDGFSPLPTVGGVLSVDAVVALQLLRIPDSPVDDGSRFGWGVGIRVGAIRESFSLPGVTLSAMHHRVGAIGYGTVDGPGARIRLEPRVTSLRLTVGKELWPVGVSAGVGWDRYRGAGRIEARTGTPGETGASDTLDLRMNRRYLFAGGSYTWLIVQFSGEMSWARNPSPTTDLAGSGPYDPDDSTVQGAVSIRIRY